MGFTSLRTYQGGPSKGQRDRHRKGARRLGGLAAAPGSKPAGSLHLFVSYSHRDEDLKNELTKHLSPLRRLNLIDDWHDGKIDAGDKWDEVISGNLRKANIVLLLISIDFINSKYCYDVEMKTALEREAAEEVVIIPVIARSCMWKNTLFSHLQALPRDGKAITTWPDQDEALTLVAEGIRDVAERILKERKAGRGS